VTAGIGHSSFSKGSPETTAEGDPRMYGVLRNAARGRCHIRLQERLVKVPTISVAARPNDQWTRNAKGCTSFIAEASVAACLRTPHH
jgi:hypothetical protein